MAKKIVKRIVSGVRKAADGLAPPSDGGNGLPGGDNGGPGLIGGAGPQPTGGGDPHLNNSLGRTTGDDGAGITDGSAPFTGS